MNFTVGKNYSLQVGALVATAGGILAQTDPSIVLWLRQHAGNSNLLMAIFLIITVAQGAAALKAHAVNHDGTPQENAYEGKQTSPAQSSPTSAIVPEYSGQAPIPAPFEVSPADLPNEHAATTEPLPAIEASRNE